MWGILISPSHGLSQDMQVVSSMQAPEDTRAQAGSAELQAVLSGIAEVSNLLFPGKDLRFKQGNHRRPRTILPRRLGNPEE